MQATLTASTLFSSVHADRSSMGSKPSPAFASARSTAPVESTQLLQGCKAVEINHNGSIYRLQATKLGKLILTK